VGEVVTRDYLRRELEDLRDLLNELQPPKEGGAKSKSDKKGKSTSRGDARSDGRGEPSNS
jgi:uncharacterized membrane protein